MAQVKINDVWYEIENAKNGKYYFEAKKDHGFEKEFCHKWEAGLFNFQLEVEGLGDVYEKFNCYDDFLEKENSYECQRVYIKLLRTRKREVVAC